MESKKDRIDRFKKRVRRRNKIERDLLDQLKNEHNSRNKETCFILLLLLNTIKNCSDINFFD